MSRLADIIDAMTLVLAVALAIGLSWTPAHSEERLTPRAILKTHGAEVVLGAGDPIEVRRVASPAETPEALYPPPKALYPIPSLAAPPVEVIRGEAKTQQYQLPSTGGPSVEVIRGEVKSQDKPPPSSGAPKVEVIMGEKKSRI